ncbi:MAG: hypothetical protein GY861_05485 [bacterium]|nr:hypothetical protein [bacterium]
MSYEASFLIMSMYRDEAFYRQLDETQDLTYTKVEWQTMSTNGVGLADWTETQLDDALAGDGFLGNRTSEEGFNYDCYIE